MFDPQPERIVCAAIKKDDIIVPGVRHFDKFMQKLVETMGLGNRQKGFGKWEQGFITNHMRFVTREEAWKVACERHQLCWGEDRATDPKFQDHGLFSEDLY